MKNLDQKLRLEAKPDWEKITEIDNKHTLKMKEIVSEFGLIDIPRFGEEVSKAAWLLIQHAPKTELEFMNNYLGLMQANPEKVLPKNAALLEDRVNMYLGKPQVYGSQIISNKEGIMEFYQIEDIEKVDIKRLSIGLEPLSNYAKRFNPEVELPRNYQF